MAFRTLVAFACLLAHGAGQAGNALVYYSAGLPSPNYAPSIETRGAPHIGNSAFELRARNLPPLSPTWIVLGTAADETSVGGGVLAVRRASDMRCLTSMPTRTTRARPSPPERRTCRVGILRHLDRGAGSVG